mmetsp:Transcript_21347/g.68861  ORF Transcript_21347/g.68861 Transcript_21347/m.68861 type:complete len:305 (-) Transcript_21347:34-948(-)
MRSAMLKRLACTRLPRFGRSMSSQTEVRAMDGHAQLVKFEVEDKIARITLCNASKMNALTCEMGEQFESLVHRLSHSDAAKDIHAAVVTGAGAAFSAGGDLQFLEDRHNDSPSRNAPIMRRFYERFLSVRQLPFPVIAAINGPAIGAGMCFALACDLRVAALDAKLGFTFVGLGLHPGMGCTHYLPGLVGQQQAARLLLTGEVVTGERAFEMGLVADAVQKEDVHRVATDYARRMARNGPVAVRSCVRTLRMNQDRGLDQALWREAEAQADCYASKDLLEGVRAVAEKRKPAFAQLDGYSEELR